MVQLLPTMRNVQCCICGMCSYTDIDILAIDVHYIRLNFHAIIICPVYIYAGGDIEQLNCSGARNKNVDKIYFI